MKRTVFCGLLTIDIQFLLEKYPRENTKSKAKEHGVFAGGPATNAAITSSFLGSNTTLLTSIGNNPFTGMLQSELDQRQVHFIDIDYQEDITPPFASIITSKKNGNRTVCSYHPKNKGEGYDVPDLLLDDTGVVLIDGFYPEMAKNLCRKARERGIPVVFDGGSWKDYTRELLPYIDMAICSENFNPPGCVSSNDTLAFLMENGIDKAVVTRGQKTMLVLENGNKYEIKPPSVKAVDTLGAGDVFHGAFVYYFNLGYDFHFALKYAADIAAQSCKSFGTRQWMKDMVVNFSEN